ncbi:MAG: hypothetical protein K2X93_06585 [Candidatus Obscuribacterales bacterium]|nr:hypothetical protein [Candidatus Obscuribacterales bacterium]
MNANVAVLKQQLEHLFPGKWLSGGDGDKILRTGIRDIDSGITAGFARRQITEWSGLSSSGKSTLLRGAIAHWCTNGLNVGYVDTFSRLVASDWAFVKEGHYGPVPLNMMQRKGNAAGEFLVVRVSESLAQHRSSLLNKGVNRSGASAQSEAVSRKDVKQEAFWVVEQLIRSTIFDAIVFDMGESLYFNDRLFARLKRALERSRTALIVLKDRQLREHYSTKKVDSDIANSGWGCHTNMCFKWSAPIHYESGMSGLALISPAIKGVVSRDGMTQNMEAKLNMHVQNRLFTHPQIPDRRTPKARA